MQGSRRGEEARGPSLSQDIHRFAAVQAKSAA